MRTRALIRVTVVLLTLLVLLTACSSGDKNVSSARAYLEALNTGDEEEALIYVCSERHEEIREGLASIGGEERANWEFQNVSCAARGEDVECRYSIVQEFEDGRQETFDREMTFKFENGLICGFEEQISR